MLTGSYLNTDSDLPPAKGQQYRLRVGCGRFPPLHERSMRLFKSVVRGSGSGASNAAGAAFARILSRSSKTCLYGGIIVPAQVLWV
jgi:hypothetical protein